MRHTQHTVTVSTSRLDERAQYMVAFSVHLRTILSRSRHPHVVDDTVSRETLRVLERASRFMQAYPDPHVLARVVASGGRAVIALGRAENVQRGAGSMGRRAVFSIDYGIEQWEADPADLRQANALSQVEDRMTLQALMAPLSKRQRTLLLLVDGYGYTVTEAAAELGIARETAARERTRAYRAIGVRPPV